MFLVVGFWFLVSRASPELGCITFWIREFNFLPIVIISLLSSLNISVDMYSSSFAIIIMLSTSFVEPIAMFKNFFRSLLDSLPHPSAMLFEIDREALLNWELMAYISSFGNFNICKTIFL